MSKFEKKLKKIHGNFKNLKNLKIFYSNLVCAYVWLRIIFQHRWNIFTSIRDIWVNRI